MKTVIGMMIAAMGLCGSAANFVTYEEFGAVGDGRTDDQAAIIKAHDDYTGQHDFGYVCHMPQRIVFDGLKIDDANHPKNYDGPAVFVNFNKANTSSAYVEKHPYQITKEVVLKNVTTASGKPVRLSPNTFMFRDVKVTRD